MPALLCPLAIDAFPPEHRARGEQLLPTVWVAEPKGEAGPWIARVHDGRWVTVDVHTDEAGDLWAGCTCGLRGSCAHRWAALRAIDDRAWTRRPRLPSRPDLVPVPWVRKHAAEVPPGPVLDLACGSGRHGRNFLERGHPVTFVDRDLTGTADLDGIAGVERLAADLEGAPWPLGERRFAAVVVVNYLWRPLFPALIAALAPGGALLYETFAVGQERYGSPRRRAFQLEPGELLEAVRGQLEVRAYTHGDDGEAVKQRICAVRVG